MACQTWVALKRQSDERYKLVFAVSNERKVSPREGQKWNKMGRLKGVSDWIILCPSKCKRFSSACIELKTPTGKLSPEQKQFLDLAFTYGSFCTVVRSVDEFMQVCEFYLEGIK